MLEFPLYFFYNFCCSVTSSPVSVRCCGPREIHRSRRTHSRSAGSKNKTKLRQIKELQDAAKRKSHAPAVKRQRPEQPPLLCCCEHRLTSKHAHRLGPPTLQSWHWPCKTADLKRNVLKKDSQIRKGEVKVWSEIQCHVISVILLTVAPMLVPQASNRIQLNFVNDSRQSLNLTSINKKKKKKIRSQTKLFGNFQTLRTQLLSPAEEFILKLVQRFAVL